MTDKEKIKEIKKILEGLACIKDSRNFEFTSYYYHLALQDILYILKKR